MKIWSATSFWARTAGDEGMGVDGDANGWASDDSEFERDGDIDISTLLGEEEENEDYVSSTVVSGIPHKDGEMAVRTDTCIHTLEVAS